MGGQVVYGNDEFKNLSPELPPASPDWSPTEFMVMVVLT